MEVRAETRSKTGGPVRTCVGCRTHDAPGELVRFVLGLDGVVLADLGGGAFGRGAWVHPRPECLEKAPRGMQKSLHVAVKSSGRELMSVLSAAADRRIKGLMSSALRAKKLALGATAVGQELAAERVRLLVVARDARAAADDSAVQAAIGRGLAVAWGTKAELGALVGRADTALAAVLDLGLARALRKAIELSAMPRAAAGIVAEMAVSAKEG